MSQVVHSVRAFEAAGRPALEAHLQHPDIGDVRLVVAGRAGEMVQAELVVRDRAAADVLLQAAARVHASGDALAGVNLAVRAEGDSAGLGRRGRGAEAEAGYGGHAFGRGSDGGAGGSAGSSGGGSDQHESRRSTRGVPDAGIPRAAAVAGFGALAGLRPRASMADGAGLAGASFAGGANPGHTGAGAPSGVSTISSVPVQTPRSVAEPPAAASIDVRA